MHLTLRLLNVVRRSVWPAFLTLATIACLTAPNSANSPTRLLSTYLITTTQLPPILTIHGAALEQVADPYISAAINGQPPQSIYEVNYPAAWFPVSGPLNLTSLNESLKEGLGALKSDVEGDPSPVVFGWSQGASVITLYKRYFNENYSNPTPGETIPTPTFITIGNPNRPNGGMWQAFAPLYIPIIDMPFIGATPTQTAGASPGEITTYDFIHQYDFFGDFPNRPLNPVALANAALGAYWGHGDYGQISPADAVLQDQVGDTAYFMIPQLRLPLLKPLQIVGVPDSILAVIDAPLRVLVENGYDRTISPGQPTTASLMPVKDPMRLTANLVWSIPTGLDDGLQQLGLGRPFGTTAAGPYGVGGPPVRLPEKNASTTGVTNDAKVAIVSTALPQTPQVPALMSHSASTDGKGDISTDEKPVSKPAALEHPTDVVRGSIAVTESRTRPSAIKIDDDAAESEGNGRTNSKPADTKGGENVSSKGEHSNADASSDSSDN